MSSMLKMEMTTMVFKWTRALSREGFTTSNLYFSELHESSYYVGRIVRPHYIAVISNYNAINEFSLATSTFDMSFAVWLVLFIYKGKGSDYCRNPPGNIFHLRFDSEMLVRCGTENILREWYSIGQNHTEIDDVAKWSLQKGISKMAPDSLYDRRWNLQGLVMKAVIVKEGPFVNVNEDGELDGVFGKILEELCVSLNFSFNIVSNIEEYGRWDPKEKTWTGAIAEISSKRADVSLSDFSMTSARLNVVDFTFPLLVTKNYLHIQEPHIFAIEWSTYFLAFSRSVWLCTYGILIVASILLIILKKQSGSARKIGHLWSDNFLEVWGILCQQGLTDFPDRSSLRITYFSMFIFCYVLLAAYSAALISFLTSSIKVIPFRSLESFIEDGTYRIAVFRGTSDYDMFAHSTDSLSRQVMKLMLDEDQLPVSMLEGFTQVCKDRKLAIYTYNEIHKDILLKIPCNIMSIEAGAVNTLSIILSKHNPFTGIINFHLQKFINNGVMYRLKEITFEKKFNDVTKHHNPVPITSVISIIFFILIGTVLSILILIIEMCFFAHRRKKKLIPLNRIALIKSSEKLVIKRNKV
ncbi:glutamate receptor 1-like isoform X1 [Polistes fuscatus]|uniref:glutamate receptor 1-like isoform X1 n=1 Tax=Polistes fuscatus TaxID=30207 RepID=UPI001CA7C490|nr:glutamate receptor 1-like isoform X1 [Polistes fuscatus]